jgi:hypothetical protein
MQVIDESQYFLPRLGPTNRQGNSVRDSEVQMFNKASSDAGMSMNSATFPEN